MLQVNEGDGVVESLEETLESGNGIEVLDGDGQVEGREETPSVARWPARVQLSTPHFLIRLMKLFNSFLSFIPWVISIVVNLYCSLILRPVLAACPAVRLRRRVSGPLWLADEGA